MKKTVIKNLFSIDQHVELYLEIIENNLDFPLDVRRRYMRLLKYEVAKYVLRHPDAVMSDVCKRFGDPYEQNGAVLRMIEKSYTREMHKRTVLFMILTAVLIVLLVVALILAIRCYNIAEPIIEVVGI